MSLKVSIIIPCYNGGEFLEHSIQSSLEQDYKNIEVIFVDNESTDDSLKVAEKIRKRNNNLIISTAPNVYKYTWNEAVEEGMKLMSGDYFTIVGADDLLATNYVSNVVEAMELSDQEILCMQSAILRMAANKKVDTVGYHYDDMKDLKRQLLIHCAVNTPTVFYKKSMYENGLMTWKSEEYLGASDYDLYCQFVDQNIMIHTFNKWLGYVYRLHENQSTWGMVEESRKGRNFDSKIKSYWKERWKN